MPSARQRYAELTAQVEEFFARVHERYRSSMQCGPGCGDCCHIRLAVTQVEAEVLADGLSGAPPELRERLAARAEFGDRGCCPALSDTGECEVYQWRPLVCRSHGAPVRAVRARAPHRLTVVDACFKNFRGPATLADVPAGDVFDQETLSSLLASIELAYCDERGLPPGERLDLAALIQRCCS